MGTRSDRDMFGLTALYRLYECAEGWVFLAVTSDAEWSSLRGALVDLDPRLADARFASAEGRADEDAELADILASVLRGRAAADWEALLLAAGVACVQAAERSPAEVLMDNLLEVPGGLTVEVQHPLWDEHPRLKPAVRFSRSLTRAPAGCVCGQHTDDLLREFGYSDQQLAHMHKATIVR